VAEDAKKADEAEDKKDETGEEGAGLEPPKKKISKKLLILLGVGGLVLVGGGVAIALHLTSTATKEQAMTETPAAQAAKEAQAEADKKAKIAFYPLGDITVNLSGEGKRPNYLKVKISLELADDKDTAAMDALKPRLVDNFQTYLRELRVDDLRGSAGLYRLREALLLRASEIAQPVRIRDVLFLEMLVQ
jgi:flagellar FliL protein